MEVKLIVREVGAPPAAKPLLEDVWRTSVISVGSSPQATLRLTGLGIAAEHVIIFEEDGHITFVNHGDGTRLNGLPVRIGDRRPLTFGDRIHIGNYVITVLDGNSPAARLDDPRATSLLQAATRELFTSGMKFDLDSLLPAAFRPSSLRKSLEIPENASFAQILEAMVAPEDSFRFVIEGGYQPNVSLPLPAGDAEVPLGWEASGLRITLNQQELVTYCALVRKTGERVVLHPVLAEHRLTVNDEPVTEPRALVDRDRIRFASPLTRPLERPLPTLVFRTPATLSMLTDAVATAPLREAEPFLNGEPADLESAGSLETDEASLRQVLEMPAVTEADIRSVAPEALPSAAAPGAPPATGVAPAVTAPAAEAATYYYLGYFTGVELAVMAVGTLLGALLVYVLLETL
ncbi:FHA domain-containing protein [Chloracidobacterium aggregatum]|uniref:FHA domain-containing protein n=1 Tax=Chloracidobacterium sp. N TaxID=2821540 RepID=A0ABX8B287_9BACT|nr:FHA domain-containing protein [Chloracidobacterium aggregatum]QUV86211.1 FHA domain-containing protein [Chloracidobacterium sp. 2]QUV89343.1 FHA domain-containing protein [Chloracidobacterium sp. S]QUV92653.1 FHA domain-containing protein [Chloracidobacterium sp. A]QUV95128.1 FHA domain-containing protein [Chloracidobacterium sp. N]QUV98338.1 FHA domain-containing protein [Chloracidobacterium sp. E]